MSADVGLITAWAYFILYQKEYLAPALINIYLSARGASDWYSKLPQLRSVVWTLIFYPS